MSTTKFEVRQQVSTVRRKWLEPVFETVVERLARGEYETLKREHPAEYFELVGIESAEDCMAFTPLGNDGKRIQE